MIKVLDKLNCKNCKGYALILMDVFMPVLGGVEAAKRIVESCKGKNKKPVIIGLTGDTDEDMRSAARGSGMTEICKKLITNFCSCKAYRI